MMFPVYGRSRWYIDEIFYEYLRRAVKNIVVCVYLCSSWHRLRRQQRARRHRDRVYSKTKIFDKKKNHAFGILGVAYQEPQEQLEKIVSVHQRNQCIYLRADLTRFARTVDGELSGYEVTEILLRFSQRRSQFKCQFPASKRVWPASRDTAPTSVCESSAASQKERTNP